MSQNGECWGGVGEDSRCHRMESVGEVLVRTGVTEWRVMERCW